MLRSTIVRSSFLVFSFAVLAANAQVRLGSPFGEHMVLPTGVPVAIWGEGCPGGDTLTVAIAGQSVTTRSDWQGRWLVKLAPMRPGGPYQMNIQIGGSGPLIVSSAANDHGGAEINDVMIGKIIVLQVPTPTNTAAVPETNHPFAQVRVFRPDVAGQGGKWLYVLQADAPPGSEAYFRTGLTLEQQLHIPIGVMILAPQLTPPVRRTP